MGIRTDEQRDIDPSAQTSGVEVNGPSPNFAWVNRDRFAMTRWRWIIAGAIGFLVIVLISYLLLRSRSPANQAEAPAASSPAGIVKFRMEQQWLIRMKLAQAEKQSVARQIISTGRVIPAARNQAIVAPPVGGILSTGPLPRIGEQVKRGQTLAVLNQRPTAAESAQIAAGNAQLRIEQSRVDAERRRLAQTANEAQVRLNQAKIEYERAQRLYERKAYSQRQLQAAEADYKAAQASYAAATQQLEALSQGSAPRLGGVGVPTSYSVRAPISGTVVKVSKAMGEQVAPGEAIVEIINLETVWVEAPIFERDLSYLSKQAKPIFTTQAYPGVEFSGTIVDIGAVINEQSRAATVVFEVPNRDRTLRIGMQANVRLDAGETSDALIIPKEAVLENEGKKIVYVLVSGEEFQRRDVTLGDEYGGKVAVVKGLEAGERVVTQGALQLKLQELRPADAGAHTHET